MDIAQYRRAEEIRSADKLTEEEEEMEKKQCWQAEIKGWEQQDVQTNAQW